MGCDVVIGAASGMGAAVARQFAEREGRLLLADVDAAGAERVAATLKGDVEVLACDVTAPDDLEAVAAAAGDIGALVLTAGLSPTMATGRTVYEVDIIAPARLLEIFEPRACAGSAAVIFSSMAGHLLPDQPELDTVLDQPLSSTFFDDLARAGVDVDDSAMAYMCSKRAVLRLVRRAATSWGTRGARVVSLSPGIIDTPMGRQENDAQPVMADMVRGSALGRMIDPDEIAIVVEFLVSPGAVAITGTDILVDGGVVAGMTS
jgi:NAD(P)-dependent dehydrogenase (short-subunit alcohol dehydrogenase family)